MKKTNFINVIIIICVIIVIGVLIWFFLQPKDTEASKESSIEGSVTIVLKSKKVEEAKTFVAFNLPSELGNQIITRPYYTLSYNKEHKQADWVAYTMYPNRKDPNVKRKNNFKVDPEVKEGASELSDYKGSKHDRGHLAPAQAMSYSQDAMDASFYLSNMSPQKPAFNQQIWRLLEDQVFKWSNQSDSVYVVTGPVLDNRLGTIGENEVSIPRSYYKTVIRFKGDEVTGIGFLLKNEKSRESFFKFATSIDSIEKITGVDFYHQMDSTLQSKVEANKKVSQFDKSITNFD